MPNSRSFLFITALIALNIIALIMIKKSNANPLKDGDFIYYLTNNKIHRIVVPNNGHADTVFTAPDDKEGENNEIYWLSCGGNDTLIFHLTHNTGMTPDFTNYNSKTTVVTYNTLTKSIDNLVDEGKTSTAFPVISSDKSKLAMIGSDKEHVSRFFIIRNIDSKSSEYYYQYSGINPSITSFSYDNKLLSMYGLSEKTRRPTIYILDIENNIITPMMSGKFPILSPDGKRIAYASPDQRMLIISDMNGTTLASFNNIFVKNIDSWINESKILFTTGDHGYQNHIGIADIGKNKTYVIKVPTSGEINGVCYKSSK